MFTKKRVDTTNKTERELFSLGDIILKYNIDRIYSVTDVCIEERSQNVAETEKGNKKQIFKISTQYIFFLKLTILKMLTTSKSNHVVRFIFIFIIDLEYSAL